MAKQGESVSTINFNIEKSEYEKLYVYFLKTDKKYRTLTWAWRILFTMGLLGGLIRAIKGQEFYAQFIVIAVLLIILSELLIPYCFYNRTKRTARTKYLSFIKLFTDISISLRDDGIEQTGFERAVTSKDDSLIVSFPRKTTFYPYVDVSSIIFNKACYYIIFTGKRNCMIPVSAFTNISECESFISVISIKTGKRIKKAPAIVV